MIVKLEVCNTPGQNTKSKGLTIKALLAILHFAVASLYLMYSLQKLLNVILGDFIIFIGFSIPVVENIASDDNKSPQLLLLWEKVSLLLDVHSSKMLVDLKK